VPNLALAGRRGGPFVHSFVRERSFGLVFSLKGGGGKHVRCDSTVGTFHHIISNPALSVPVYFNPFQVPIL
jgi:hypothetical protein